MSGAHGTANKNQNRFSISNLRKVNNMNFFEKLILGLVSAAPAAVPIFVHSPHGLVIANASEALLAGVLQQFAPPPIAVKTPFVGSGFAPAAKIE